MSAKKNNKKNTTVSVKNEPAPQPVAAQAKNVPMADDEETRSFKAEALVWMLTVICSVVVYVIAANIVLAVYHPDINVLKDEASKILFDTSGVRPEPVESMLFRVAVVTILLSLIGFYKLFTRMKALREQASGPLFMALSSACVVFILAMIYLGFAAQNPFVKDGGDIPQNSRDFIGKSNFDFFFDGLFLGSYVWVYTLVLVPLLACLFLLGIKKYRWDEKKTFNTGVNVVGYLVVGGAVLACVAMSIFSFPYTFENKFNFNAVYYSTTQVYAGTPLLTNHFTNTYGLYPQFLNLIFQVTGLNVFKFSLVMGLLIGAAFTMNFFSLRRIIDNKVILFLGMAAVIFFPFLDFKLGQNFDCNFAVYPIRYITTSFIIFMATLYLQNRSKAAYWATMIAGSFFVLWNPEIGMVSYMSWLAMHTYNDFYAPGGRMGAVKKIVFHWVIGIGTLVAVFFIYKGIVSAIYGVSPDLSLLFGTALVFGKIGFYLLPMKLIHPWNIMALILILSFLYTIARWARREITPRSSAVFLISVIGIGYFIYFQGRSHNWQLAQSSSMSLMLLAILGDRLWAGIKDKNILPLNALFAVFLFTISFGFFETIYNADKINAMVKQEDDKDKDAQEQAAVEASADFILKNSHEKEKIHVISATQFQGLYFDGSKRRSAFNPGIIDLFAKADLTRFEDIMIDSSFSVFIQPSVVNYPSMIRPCAAMAATYELKSASGSMAMLTKRTAKVPAQSFFKRQDQLIYRKYTDDKAGIKQRINDATGISPITPPANFSVEVLFRSGVQIFQFASLLGNMTDSAGFMIYNIISTPNYFFGINGKGAAVPLPQNAWVYCVMNVYPDHIEVYADGALVNSFGIPQPMRQSHEKLAIANVAFMHYYLGAIAEVAINNSPLDKATVEQTWNAMKAGTQ